MNHHQYLLKELEYFELRGFLLRVALLSSRKHLHLLLLARITGIENVQAIIQALGGSRLRLPNLPLLLTQKSFMTAAAAIAVLRGTSSVEEAAYESRVTELAVSRTLQALKNYEAYATKLHQCSADASPL